MKKGFKYIEFEGYIVTMSETYFPGTLFATFTGVELANEKGEVLNIDSFMIPTALLRFLQDDKGAINLGVDVTFHMLRYRNKEKYHVAVFAVETNGEKAFYQADATKTLVMFARSASFRWSQLKFPPSFAVLGTFGGAAAFMLPAAVFQGTLGFALGVALAARWVYWFTYPFIRGEKYAGIDEMKAIAQREGFQSRQSVPAAKY